MIRSVRQYLLWLTVRFMFREGYKGKEKEMEIELRLPFGCDCTKTEALVLIGGLLLNQ